MPKKLTSPYLAVEQIRIGKQTKQHRNIICEKHRKNKLINEVKQRLKSIDIDRVLDAGIVEGNR